MRSCVSVVSSTVRPGGSGSTPSEISTCHGVNAGADRPRSLSHALAASAPTVEVRDEVLARTSCDQRGWTRRLCACSPIHLSFLETSMRDHGSVTKAVLDLIA